MLLSFISDTKLVTASLEIIPHKWNLDFLIIPHKWNLDFRKLTPILSIDINLLKYTSSTAIEFGFRDINKTVKTT